MEKVGITINDVKQMKMNMIQKKIIEWDENIWRNNMKKKIHCSYIEIIKIR